MATISLVRVDSSLVHGQVVTGWIMITHVDRVIVIDDQTRADPFLTQINQLASPIPCEVMSVDEAVSAWKENRFGNRGNLLVLFQYIRTACAAYKAGIRFPLLQLGNIGGGSGRKTIVESIALTEEEAHLLNGCYKEGMKIEFCPHAENKRIPWQPTISQVYPSVN